MRIPQLLPVLLLTTIGISAVAQDAHYTQTLTSPLTLNPAMTGLIEADQRVSVNYRSQWASVSNNPYTTETIAYDVAILKNILPKGDALGLGLLGLHDRSGEGGLETNIIGLSAAYHKAFGKTKQHTLSLGVQGMLVMRDLDFSLLRFENQFDAASGGTPYPTHETNGKESLSYSDYNAGIMYSGRFSKRVTVYAGFAYYHLSTPVESFFNGSHTIAARLSGCAGTSIGVSDKTILYASGIYEKQASATQVLAGGALGIYLHGNRKNDKRSNAIVYVGNWYRFGDAMCPYAGFEWYKMRLGLSYDINTSSFTPATGGAGAFEISLVFNGRFSKQTTPVYNMARPKF